MTGSSGDAARDRMQPPSFWRDLGAEFRGLPDPVWANKDAPDRLQISNGKVRGGDKSLRAQFKHVADLGGMALCAEQGFGADLFDAAWMWDDAVTAYLKEEKSPWYTEFRSTRWKPGPAKKQELLVVEIDCISVASADLCRRLETEAFGRQIATPVERPVTPPDGSTTLTPVTTPPTRRERVDDFLARCNREYTGPGKLIRKDIWTQAGHKTGRQFEYWQKEDEDATGADRRNFERILGKAPQAFIHDRAKKQHRL